MPVLRMVAMAIAKSFSKLFGLATITFFGRVPTRDDDKVGAIGFLSLVWLVTLPAVVFPELAEMLIPFLPEDDTILRALAIAIVIGVPPIIGFLTSRVHNRDERGWATVRQMLFGYVYAGAVGGLVVGLVVIVPIVKISYIFRRFDLKHMSIMIHSGTHDEVREQIRDALRRHGIETTVEEANAAIRWIFGGLVWVESHIFRRDMSYVMQLIRGESERTGGWFEVTLHATDISIIGQKPETTRVLAILAEELDEQHVYFSWDDACQALEDEIRDAQEAVGRGETLDEDTPSDFSTRLRDMALDTDEWNTLRRQIYRIEVAHHRNQAEQLRRELSSSQPPAAVETGQAGAGQPAG